MPRKSREQQRHEVLYAFYYDVGEATAFLFHALSQINLYEEKVDAPIRYDGLRVCWSTLIRTPHDRVSRSDGEVGRFLFDAWVTRIASRWESRHRNQMKVDGEDAILPLVSVMGDINQLRNVIFHKNGVVDAECVRRTMILTWFKEGEEARLTTDHVFDFLNQLALPSTSYRADRFQEWATHFHRHQLLGWKPSPRIISTRVFRHPDGIAIAFDNGVFTNIPVNYETLGDPLLDSDGNINLRDGTKRSGREIYEEGVRGMFDPRVKPFGDTLIPGPWFQIRKLSGEEG